MRTHWRQAIGLFALAVLLVWPGSSSGRAAGPAPDVHGGGPTHRGYLPLALVPRAELSIQLGTANVEKGLTLQQGGDTDTEAVTVGTPPSAARRTGNGRALPATDGNTIPDNYMQFDAQDAVLFKGAPTGRLVIGIEYLDQGADEFVVQYDGRSGGPFGDGRFRETPSVRKGNTGSFRTISLRVCDAYFANRDNGGDFRIDDRGDGAETVRQTWVALLPAGPVTIRVDECGANPWDLLPDSDAIQRCIDRACDGDTILFTSGAGLPGYQGYRIDKTVFLEAASARRGLTFTSSDPARHALLVATTELKGFVMRLWARSRITDPGAIDDITVSHLDLDGGRSVRRCFGADGVEDGANDNWGSWLPECTEPGDAWCRAGTLAMEGLHMGTDLTQDYLGQPWYWSTGLLAEDLRITGTECGTALAMDGAASTIRNVTIDTAGDHVHAPGCAATEADEGVGDWSDGITFTGPGHLVRGNTIYDPSDVGIVFFGGKNTVISGNTVAARAGNHGMFAGIAVHPWIFGDVSGVQVTGNRVTSEGDTACGGIHAGINLGQHMWGAGCVGQAHPTAVGNRGACLAEPPAPAGAVCQAGALCQEWAHVAAGRTLTLSGNTVAGAHINYLVEGLDLVGRLVESGNIATGPRLSDWESAAAGCSYGGYTDTWGATNRIAHHPNLAGWSDTRVHCER